MPETITHDVEVAGKDLKVGDIITTWWEPGTDMIKGLTPYTGNYERDPDFRGARIASFGILKVGMTIFPDEHFSVVNHNRR